MIYVRDNVVVQNAGHYRVNKHRKGKPYRDAKWRCLASPWRVLFSITTGDVLYIITRLLAKTKPYLHTACHFTITIRSVISREIVRQRRWRRLETGHAAVDKLPDYLRSAKKDVNQAKYPPSLTAVKFGMHKYRLTNCEILQLLMPSLQVKK